jgi:hypothetical protein
LAPWPIFPTRRHSGVNSPYQIASLGHPSQSKQLTSPNQQHPMMPSPREQPSFLSLLNTKFSSRQKKIQNMFQPWHITALQGTNVHSRKLASNIPISEEG